jgi:serine/threonine protein kinase
MQISNVEDRQKFYKINTTSACTIFCDGRNVIKKTDPAYSAGHCRELLALYIPEDLNVVRYTNVDNLNLELVMKMYSKIRMDLPWHSYVYDLLHTLMRLHELGIMIMDIKTSNVMYDNEKCRHIFIDFGTANQCDDPYVKRPYYMDRTTITYRAPETFTKSAYYSARSDVWSLGNTFLNMYLGNELLQNILGVNYRNYERIEQSFIDELLNTHVRDPTLHLLLSHMLRVDHDERSTAQHAFELLYPNDRRYSYQNLNKYSYIDSKSFAFLTPSEEFCQRLCITIDKTLRTNVYKSLGQIDIVKQLVRCAQRFPLEYRTIEYICVLWVEILYINAIIELDARYALNYYKIDVNRMYNIRSTIYNILNYNFYNFYIRPLGWMQKEKSN